MSAKPANEPRFLAYALPRASGDRESRVIPGDGFIIHDEPAQAPVSFLDYDGVVVFAGAFETVNGWRELQCKNPADLDLREREFYTCYERGRSFILLLPHMIRRTNTHYRDPQTDLFRRIATSLGLDWNANDQPYPCVDSLVPEFREYVSRYGAGYVVIEATSSSKEFTRPICKGGKLVFGADIARKLLFLPCVVPQKTPQVQDIVLAAVGATVRYRKRLSQELPLWVNDLSFERESKLRRELESHQQKAIRLEGEIDQYAKWKGALCLQSEPLVDLIVRLFESFFAMKLKVDDKKIEDATLVNDNGAITAVFEIKGVKGNFTRENVNQVDSHRERLGLPSNTPGVLIMNTMHGAESLKEKGEPPHPDIVKKAHGDNVLLIRTLDLIGLADGVERGTFAREQLQQLVTGKGGWLRVDDGRIEVLIE